MIYEEKQTGIGPALLLLCGVFLFSYSPWLLSLRDLFWQEGVYAGISSELSGIPPLLTLHGEYVNGVFPFYPVLVIYLFCFFPVCFCSLLFIYNLVRM